VTTNPDNNPPFDKPPFVVDCAYCVEGFRPLNVDQFMGPLYQGCIHCSGICRGCDGTAVFPAAPAKLSDFLAALNAQGWAPTFCPSCLGVTVLTLILPGDTLP